MNCSRNEGRKFYEKIKRQAGGLKTGAAACRHQHGNLMADIQGELGLWREFFDGLLNGDTNTDEVEPEIPIAND